MQDWRIIVDSTEKINRKQGQQDSQAKPTMRELRTALRQAAHAQKHPACCKTSLPRPPAAGISAAIGFSKVFALHSPNSGSLRQICIHSLMPRTVYPRILPRICVRCNKRNPTDSLLIHPPCPRPMRRTTHIPRDPSPAAYYRAQRVDDP